MANDEGALCVRLSSRSWQGLLQFTLDSLPQHGEPLVTLLRAPTASQDAGFELGSREELTVYGEVRRPNNSASRA